MPLRALVPCELTEGMLRGELSSSVRDARANPKPARTGSLTPTSPQGLPGAWAALEHNGLGPCFACPPRARSLLLGSWCLLELSVPCV